MYVNRVAQLHLQGITEQICSTDKGNFMYFACSQTLCMNCGGNDPVTFEWTLVSDSGATPLDERNVTSYGIVDSYDGSLELDVSVFTSIVDVEVFTLFFRGA